jgi:hypothetical protein
MSRIHDIDIYSPDLDQYTRMNLMFDFIIRIGYGLPVCQFLWKDELKNLKKVNTQCNEIIPKYVERWGANDLCKNMIVKNNKEKICSNRLEFNGCCDICNEKPYCPCRYCGDFADYQIGPDGTGGMCDSCAKESYRERYDRY